MQKHNEMGTLPIGKLLAKTAVPMMISMLVQALYNVVDSLFIARVNQDALNAISLAFPLQTLMIGVGIGTAVGTNAMLSRYLGAKLHDAADRCANVGVMLALGSYLVFALIGLTFSRTFFELVTSNEQIVRYGTQYCTICLMVSVGFFTQAVFERMLTATGRSKLAMTCQLIGALTNIALDPVFIFGVDFLGIPALEVAGAAIATVIGQCVAGALAMMIVIKKVPEINISVKKMRWHGPTVAAIYQIGIPSIIMQCISSVMNFGMNLILIQFTEAATAFFGVYYKLQSFIFMPIFGLNNGMVPIVSYNFGAKNRERLWGTVKLSMVIAISIMSVGCLLFETLPHQLLSLFNASEELQDIGSVGLRIIAVHFPVAGFCIIAGSVFQAVGNPVHSVIVSVGRQLAVLLPASWLLGHFFGLAAVWAAFPIAEVISLMLSAIFMKKTLASVNAKIKAPEM